MGKNEMFLLWWASDNALEYEAAKKIVSIHSARIYEYVGTRTPLNFFFHFFFTH